MQDLLARWREVWRMLAPHQQLATEKVRSFLADPTEETVQEMAIFCVHGRLLREETLGVLKGATRDEFVRQLRALAA